MRLFIGSLPFSSDADDVRELLADFGPSSNVRVMIDRETGKSIGVAFADMDDGAGIRAIAGLNGIGYRGRWLKVEEARPMREGGRERRREFARR